MKGSKVIWNDNLRHNYHAEVQPVPGVPQEGEGVDAEAPRQHLYQRLKRVNASERVPERKRERRDGQRFIQRSWTQTWSREEMWSTVQQPLWHEWVAPPPPERSGFWSIFLFLVSLGSVLVCIVPLITSECLSSIAPLSCSQTGPHGIHAESMELILQNGIGSVTSYHQQPVKVQHS